MLVALTDIKHDGELLPAGSTIPDDWDDDLIAELEAVDAVGEPELPPDTIVIPKAALQALPADAKDALRSAGFDIVDDETVEEPKAEAPKDTKAADSKAVSGT